MVSFICDACGNSVKKNQVEKHYLNQCRKCSVLSCIDCGVDFPGDSYKDHTSCITEAEKYQGHLYQAKEKENKGEIKQKEWLKHVHGTSGATEDPRLKGLLKKLSVYSNIPRKKKKFENFCKNSVNVYDTKTLEQLWDLFNTKNDETSKENDSDKITNEPAVNGDESVENSSHDDSENPSPEVEALNQDTKLNVETTKKKKKKKKKSLNESAIEGEIETGGAELTELMKTGTEAAMSNENINNDGLESISQTKKKKKKKKLAEVGDKLTENTQNLLAVYAEDDEKNNIDDKNGCDEYTKIKKKKHSKSKKNKGENVNDLVNGDASNNIVVNGKENQVESKKQKKGKKHKIKEDTVVTEEVQPISKKKKDLDEDNREDNEIEEDAAPQGKFHWHKTIKLVLKQSEDNEISVKKLRKKVLSAYQEHGVDHRASTIDECCALFDKKLKTYPKVKISKNVVKLVT